MSRVTPRFSLAVGLVVLLAGCGDAESPSQQRSAAKQAPRAICGYDAAEPMPAEAAQVLPGRPVLLSSETLADGGFRGVALVDLPLARAFDAIIRRAEAGGWSVEDREREIGDAEIELTRETQRLSLALSRSDIPGCVATRVEMLFSPQG
jgi:hypothetical protein